MGSSVLPYFISSSEKFTLPKPIKPLPAELDEDDRTPPITPTPSASTDLKGRQKSKKKERYKPPVAKRHESTRKKMEIIKERLEKSRERYRERRRLQEESELNCGPTVIGLDDNGDIPKLDRSMSDLGPSISDRYPTKRADGSFPYVYFVVSQDTIAESEEFGLESDGNQQIVRNVRNRRRKIYMEQHKKKKEKQAKAAKMQGIAREMGLKSSSIAPKNVLPERPVTQPAINHIVFPIAAPSSAALRRIHSPPRIPPGTPATTILTEYRSPDPDDMVPRKPFPSGPLYEGKSRTNAYSLHTFELPFIPPEQRKRALGLASSENFGDYNCSMKPQSQQRQRKVTFAESLPVIRGSGFLFGDKDTAKNDDSIPQLGPRASTMGSITLPSEKTEKQEKCQRYHLSDKDAVKIARKMGIPLALPKIDIVSNVYDEMIIKMIRDYLQDSNTPSRQAQLARDLLAQLQQNETITQMEKVREEENMTSGKINDSSIKKETKKVVKIAEEPVEKKTSIEEALSQVVVQDMPTFEEIHNNKPKTPSTPVATARNVPFVKITYKPSNDVSDGSSSKTGSSQLGKEDNSLQTPEFPPQSASSAKGSSKSRCSVTPTSFVMAPPGLSREETNLSISLNP